MGGEGWDACLQDGHEHGGQDRENGSVLRHRGREVAVEQQKCGQQQHAQRAQHHPVQRRQQSCCQCAPPRVRLHSCLRLGGVPN